MNKLPLKAEFFTKISYVKDEPTIEVVPVAMPNYQQAITIGENRRANWREKSLLPTRPVRF